VPTPARLIFRQDGYVRTCAAKIADIDERSSTHFADVSEIGPVHISTIDKKGRESRRFRIRFAAIEAQNT
jgi:Ser-tRNA(Ala) deacylase AlaX